MNNRKNIQLIGLTILLAVNMVVSANDSLLQQIIGGLLKPVAREVFEGGKILGGAVGGAVAYGIINDQVTVRVCPEYFTEGFHKYNVHRMKLSQEQRAMLLNKENLTKIGLWWGVHATWWFGALLAVPTIAAARVPLGSLPQLRMEDLVKPLAIGMAGVLGTGLLAGVKGYYDAKSDPEYANSIINQCGANIKDQETKNRYVADVYAHQVGYAGGAAVTLGLVGYTLYERYNRS